MHTLPSIADLSSLSESEKTLLKSVRDLQMMGGIDARMTDVQQHIDGITSLVGGLTRMAQTTARDHPEDFAKLSTIAQYIGTMLWEWHLRLPHEEGLRKLEELGRSTAIIGRGLFPLDDTSHPLNQETEGL